MDRLGLRPRGRPCLSVVGPTQELLSALTDQRIVHSADYFFRVGSAFCDADAANTVNLSEEDPNSNSPIDRGVNGDGGVAVEQVIEFLKHAALAACGQSGSPVVDYLHGDSGAIVGRLHDDDPLPGRWNHLLD